MSETGTVHSINTSRGGVPKLPQPEAFVTAEGVTGDRQRDRRYHGGPLRAVCLYSLERIRALQAEGHPVDVGTMGENLTVAGLDWDRVGPGVRLAVGPVALEITKDAPPCKTIAGSFRDGALRCARRRRSTPAGAGSTRACSARAPSGWATRSYSARVRSR